MSYWTLSASEREAQDDVERQVYDSCVHGLRSAGWSRLDAESEALARIEKLRQRWKNT
jgi:hypothetical protein